MSRTILQGKRHIVVLLCLKGKYSVSPFIVKQKQRLKRLNIIRSLDGKRRTEEKTLRISLDRKYYTNTATRKNKIRIYLIPFL